jgi:DnaK suppressor protein
MPMKKKKPSMKKITKKKTVAKAPAKKKTVSKKPSKQAKKPAKVAKRPVKAVKKQKKTVQKPAKVAKRPVKAVKKQKKTSRISISYRDKKILEIKKKLLSRRETLLAEAEEALNELPGQTVFPDLGDQATAEIDRNFMLRLRGRERKLLKKIEDAIDRIDQGTFGICDKCGEEINIKRLEARPVTSMCIDCKTQQEEEEKLMEV